MRFVQCLAALLLASIATAQTCAPLTILVSFAGVVANPSPYDGVAQYNATACVWNIVLPGIPSVNLTVDAMDLTNLTTLTIFDNAAQMALATFDNSSVGGMNISASANLTLTFSSDGLPGGTGFHISYRGVYPQPSCQASAIACTSDVRNPDPSLTSSPFYSPNANCSWDLLASGRNINTSFVSFNLASGDEVVFYDGNSASTTPLFIYDAGCPGNTVATLWNTDYIRVEFHSGDYPSRGEFWLQWGTYGTAAIPPPPPPSPPTAAQPPPPPPPPTSPCSVNTFLSTASGEINYPAPTNGHNCSWTIVLPVGYKVSVKASLSAATSETYNVYSGTCYSQPISTLLTSPISTVGTTKYYSVPTYTMCLWYFATATSQHSLTVQWQPTNPGENLCRATPVNNLASINPVYGVQYPFDPRLTTYSPESECTWDYTNDLSSQVYIVTSYVSLADSVDTAEIYYRSPLTLQYVYYADLSDISTDGQLIPYSTVQVRFSSNGAKEGAGIKFAFMYTQPLPCTAGTSVTIADGNVNSEALVSAPCPFTPLSTYPVLATSYQWEYIGSNVHLLIMDCTLGYGDQVDIYDGPSVTAFLVQTITSTDYPNTTLIDLNGSIGTVVLTTRGTSSGRFRAFFGNTATTYPPVTDHTINHSNTNAGAIVGIVFGCFFGFFCLFIACIWISEMDKKRKQEARNRANPPPPVQLNVITTQPAAAAPPPKVGTTGYVMGVPLAPPPPGYAAPPGTVVPGYAPAPAAAPVNGAGVGIYTGVPLQQSPYAPAAAPVPAVSPYAPQPYAPPPAASPYTPAPAAADAPPAYTAVQAVPYAPPAAQPVMTEKPTQPPPVVGGGAGAAAAPPTMNFCPMCGTPRVAGGKFCASCGTSM